MNPLASYSFLPWLRQGIANTITAADGDQAVKARATTHVELSVTGDRVGGGAALVESVGQDVALYGPGDLVGIDPRAVVRTEPRHRVTSFESNYLAAIDFYDEDFPWRYTPAAPGANHLRLRPWIALVVLKQDEFKDGAATGRPLSTISVANPNAFPPADELWAWAHVHVNESLAASPAEIVSADMTAVLPRVQAVVDRSPDSAYSRLLCPRRLEDETDYHAFVVPAFETGRLAGLGEKPGQAPFATASAWAPYPDRPASVEYPVYYRWSFRTGSHGDFEYLVRLLKAQPVDPRVGVRNMDVRHPGSNLPGIGQATLGGVLRLGGALQVPEADLDSAQLKERNDFENWDEPYPHDFQKRLAAFVNLPDDYAAHTAADANAASGLGAAATQDPDPLITAPLYGCWHALTQRLLRKRDGSPADHDRNWVHELNLDPRFRVPAGFGTDVIQQNAEEYMHDAWQQIGDVLEANSRIRRLHLGIGAASQWFDRQLVPLLATHPERAFILTAPVHDRVLAGGSTIAHLRRDSRVPPAMTSPAMRRVVRPGGRLIRGLPFAPGVEPGNLLERLNRGEVAAAPPKGPASGAVQVDDVAAAARPPSVPAGVEALLARFPWLPWALIALGLVLLVILAIALPFAVGLAVGLLVLLALVMLAWLLWRWRAALAPGASLREGAQTPGSVAGLPKNPGFAISEPGSGHSTPVGATDSHVGRRFKEALVDAYGLIQGSGSVSNMRPPAKLDLGHLTETAVRAIDPTVTIPRRGLSSLEIPDWVKAQLEEDFGEVMAYPKIDLPMFRPLKAISDELFLPNLRLIPPNSITLVETNQRFIESYMVGLNHEFGRELLWREYPTDLRCTTFRQFWDVRSVINTEGLSENALKERLYDIPEIHRWPRSSELGTHNHRQPPGTKREQAVLVIRGELLRKYPTAVIYAHLAEWERKPDGTPDLGKVRTLARLTSAEEADPPRSKVRAPLYEAKADPDVYFFGFDLTVPEAKGGSGHPSDDAPGWFFVIKERPGDPRFGFDLSGAPAQEVMDELTWDDAATAPGAHLGAVALASVTLQSPAGDPEGKQPQHDDDVKANQAASSSARWAYLLFRSPVMVAVHADEMLRKDQ
jgi:hypothetical protein